MTVMNLTDHTLPDPACFADPFFFFSSNREAELEYVSPSVEQVLGYLPTELIGRRYLDFLDKTSSLNRNVDELRERRFRGDGHQTQLRVVETRDQKLKVLKVQTYGRTDETGAVVSSHAIAQDVTNVYFAEEELNDRWMQLTRIADQLSEREKNVLCRITEGALNKVIARELEVGERTVEKIRSRLVEKFQADSISQVVSKATQLEMLRDVILLARDGHESTHYNVCP